MVLVHDTSSRRGLQVYQVSLKIFNGFQVIERTRFVTDGQTDRQTDARGKTICLPTLSGGDIKIRNIVSDGAKYRSPSNINFDRCTEEIASALIL